MKRYTVSLLTFELKELLISEYPELLVEGEISGFKPNSSGHWYFSLKDDRAVLSCAMFRNANARFRPPREGDRVLLRGALDLYAPRGGYSLIVRDIQPLGEGDLAQKLVILKEKLAKEGLFDPRRKKPIPDWPISIGVATSPTGAAFQDIIRVIQGRFPGLPVYLAPCKVQGDGAAEEIARAIGLLNRHGKASVLIAGRGGGSVEDLWCFNEEKVVRAVAASTIPVVSAVGHETDTTLCDFAADLRAATPSHAAERVTPSRAEFLGILQGIQDRLQQALQSRLKLLRQRVSRARLIHPRQRVITARLRADELHERLQGAIERRLHRARERLLKTRLKNLQGRVATSREHIAGLEKRIFVAGRNLLLRRRDRLQAAIRELEALSPLSVLARGYTVVEREGKPVMDAFLIEPGDSLTVRFRSGEADVRVEEVRK
jgi:exodeoxyribonuclease VII large subunit